MRASSVSCVFLSAGAGAGHSACADASLAFLSVAGVAAGGVGPQVLVGAVLIWPPHAPSAEGFSYSGNFFFAISSTSPRFSALAPSSAPSAPTDFNHLAFRSRMPVIAAASVAGFHAGGGAGSLSSLAR